MTHILQIHYLFPSLISIFHQLNSVKWLSFFNNSSRRLKVLSVYLESTNSWIKCLFGKNVTDFAICNNTSMELSVKSVFFCRDGAYSAVSFRICPTAGFFQCGCRVNLHNSTSIWHDSEADFWGHFRPIPLPETDFPHRYLTSFFIIKWVIYAVVFMQLSF